MAQLNSELKITMYWGDILYDTAICKPDVPVTIGREAKNTFILDLQTEASMQQQKFTLVELKRDGIADLYFDEHYDGHIKKGDQLFSLANAKSSGVVERKDNGVYSAKLSKNDKADIVIGHVSFYFDWVQSAEKIPAKPFIDKKVGLLSLLSLLLVFGVIFLLQTIQLPEEEPPPERLVHIEPSKRSRATSPNPNTAEASKAAIGAPKTADGGAQTGPSGKVETKAAEKPSAASSLRKANLGSLVSGLTSTGSNAPTTDNKAKAVDAAITQQGTGGFSTEGLKQGGGGKTTGIGRAVGAGEGGFSGTGRLGVAGNSSIDGVGAGGGGSATKVAGGLDRDVIESIIRKRLDRIRLCYDRQLNFHPKLAGKITVRFIIGKTGNVIESGAIEDTMKNATVKTCVLNEVKSWNFPNPEGGTLVNVDYPFVFESSNRGN